MSLTARRRRAPSVTNFMGSSSSAWTTGCRREASLVTDHDCRVLAELKIARDVGRRFLDLHFGGGNRWLSVPGSHFGGIRRTFESPEAGLDSHDGAERVDLCEDECA